MKHDAALQARRTLLMAIVNLAAAAGIMVILAIGIHITGFQIVYIFCKTSYFDYPFFLIGVPLMLACIFCIRAAIIAVRGFRELPPYMPSLITIITPAMVLLFCVLSITYFNAHRERIHRARPSAPEGFRSQIGPVLQFGPFQERHADASTSAVIWYFDPAAQEAPAEILFGTDPVPGRMASLAERPGDGRRHEFHLAGLMPATRYYYRVPGLDGRVRSFHTAPARGIGAAVRFMALADTGNTKRSSSAHSYYAEVIRAANLHYAAAGEESAFRIHAGDMVREGCDLEGWREHFSSDNAAASIPLIVTPGNHEYLGDGGANFRYFFGQPEYHAIDYGDARIICLHPFDGPGRTLDGPMVSTGNEQYRWVRDELARSEGVPWLIVLIHIPILSTGDYGSNEILKAQYFDLFKEHGVDLVLSGHDHNLDIFEAEGGPLYLVAGTGGSHLDSYIMDRRARRWPGWINAPARERAGRWRHVYGELSWGFTDVSIQDTTMAVSYYRWLGFPRFLEITGQDRREWDMPGFDEMARERHSLNAVERVTRAVKIR